MLYATREPYWLCHTSSYVGLSFSFKCKKMFSVSDLRTTRLTILRGDLSRNFFFKYFNILFIFSKIIKCKTAEKEHLWSFLSHFCCFSVIYGHFYAKNVQKWLFSSFNILTTQDMIDILLQFYFIVYI